MITKLSLTAIVITASLLLGFGGLTSVSNANASLVSHLHHLQFVLNHNTNLSASQIADLQAKIVHIQNVISSTDSSTGFHHHHFFFHHHHFFFNNGVVAGNNNFHHHFFHHHFF